MNNKGFFAVSLVVLGVIAAATIVHARTPIQIPVTGTEQSLCCQSPEDVLSARDSAIAYVQYTFDFPQLAAIQSWDENGRIMPGSDEESLFEYEAQGWNITVLSPVPDGEKQFYTVMFYNDEENFNWVGYFDVDGNYVIP